MTFGEYYELKGQGLSPHMILEEAHADMLSTARKGISASECKKLETFLNQLFYPKKYKGNANKYYDTVNDLIKSAYKEEYDKVLDKDFNIGSKDGSYTAGDINNLYKVSREKYETFKHTDRIYFETLEKRKKNLENMLSNIKPDQITSKDLNQYREMAKKCIEDIERIILHRTGSKHKFLVLKEDEDLLQQVANIDAAYKALSADQDSLSPQDYGQILEWTLQAVSSDEEGSIVDNIKNEVSENLIKAMMGTAGSQKTIAKKSNAFNGNINIKNTSMDIKRDSGGSIESRTFTIGTGKNKLSFEYQPSFNPHSSRQGKVDVNFNLEDNGQLIPFKISAKNWKSLVDRDFGNTNLAYALIRSLGDDNAHKYLYMMQDGKRIGNELKEIHSIAKFAIILDILMGLSQKESYADTVVINVREEERIIVFSIVDVLEEIYKNLTRIRVDGYDEHNTRSNLIKIRKAVLAAGVQQSSSFNDLSIKYLQSLRVYLQYKTIKPFIKH